MLKVIKRNGDVAEFDLKRISDAIMKAFVATDVQYTNDIVDLLSLRVTADFQEKVKDEEVHVEDVQDSVERVLEQAGLKVSSLYISQIKRKCGLDVGQNYNLSKKEDAKVPQCPPEKEAAIMEALKYFQMI